MWVGEGGVGRGIFQDHSAGLTQERRVGRKEGLSQEDFWLACPKQVSTRPTGSPRARLSIIGTHHEAGMWPSPALALLLCPVTGWKPSRLNVTVDLKVWQLGHPVAKAPYSRFSGMGC